MKLVLPDVAVEDVGGPSGRTRRQSPAAMLEPVTIPFCPPVEVREVFIRIVRREDRSLVTVIEVLSPSNKSSAGLGIYLEKRSEIVRSPVHLVELDLLLGGERLPMARPLPAGDFYAFVSRGENRPDRDVYAWTLRSPLPAIPIPLTATHSDVAVDLAAVFAGAWQYGAYDRVVNYSRTSALPVSAEDADWITATAAVAQRAF